MKENGLLLKQWQQAGDITHKLSHADYADDLELLANAHGKAYSIQPKVLASMWTQLKYNSCVFNKMAQSPH